RSDFSPPDFSFSESQPGCLRQIVYGIFLRVWSESGPAPDNKPAPRPSPSRKSNIGQSDSPPDALKSSVSGWRHPAKKCLTPEPVPNFIIRVDERTREKNLHTRGRACARRGREHGHVATLRAQGRSAKAAPLAERLPRVRGGVARARAFSPARARLRLHARRVGSRAACARARRLAVPRGARARRTETLGRRGASA